MAAFCDISNHQRLALAQMTELLRCKQTDVHFSALLHVCTTTRALACLCKNEVCSTRS